MNRNDYVSNIGDPINIIFITDDKFALPTAVAIQSLFNNRNIQLVYHIYIVCNQVSESNCNKFLEMKKENFDIYPVFVSETQLHQQFIKADFPVSVSATFKFFLPELFPDLKKALYIDGDVIIQSDLAKLYFTDVSDVYAGVIKDYHALTFKGDVWERLGIKLSAYFNSGIMLLNLDKMRTENITQKLIEYRLNGINYYMDQDALNVVFNDNVIYIDFKYNLTLTNWRNKSSEELSNYYEIPFEVDKYDYLRNADIVHFASSDKPWVYYDTHYADQWLYYFFCSPFQSTQLNRKSLNTVIKSTDIAKIRIQSSKTIFRNYSINPYHLNPITPSFSVIIPVYNAEKYLEEMMNSVVSQTFGDCEIICVDDGSTDNSPQLLEKWAKDDSRIKVIRQQNLFAGVARNNAIAISSGEYIVFLDSDDILAPNALEVFYNTAKCNKDIDVIICSTSIFKTSIHTARKTQNWLNKDYLPFSNIFPPEEIFPFIFNFSTGGPGGKCFRKEFVNKHNLKFLDFRKSEDFYFIHSGIALANLIATIEEPLYFIREVSTSLEHQKDNYPLLFWDAVMKFKQLLIDKNIFDVTKQSFINENINRFTYNLKTMKTKTSYNAVLQKLSEIAKDELGLGEYPPKYYYRKDNYEFLCKALSLPVSYREEHIQVPTEKSTLIKTVAVLQNGNNSKDEAQLIRSSWSYKIGRFITFIPRKLRGGIRCYKENGFDYTLRRVKEKFLALIGR